MDYFNIKSKLLRYALAKTGLLDADALDLDKLNLSVGRNSNAEFRDVGLRLEKLTALLQLPPSIRLLAASAVLVRVSVTTDFSITAEVDGIEVRASIQHVEPQNKDERHPESLRTPRHRKTARRIPPLTAYDPGDLAGLGAEDAHLPTSYDVAKSYLDLEPVEEREELETAILSQSAKLDESTTSVESDESAVGTGNGLGLPAFLAGMIQGVVDKLKVHIRDVKVTCDANLPSQAAHIGDRSMPISLVLSIKSIDVDPVATHEPTSSGRASNSGTYLGRRHVSINHVALDMLCEPSNPTESSHFSLRSSVIPTPKPITLSRGSGAAPNSSMKSSNVTLPTLRVNDSVSLPGHVSTTLAREQPMVSSPSPTVLAGSGATLNRGRFANADEDDPSSVYSPNASEIRPGEDCNSYTSRRTRSSSDQDQPFNPSLETSRTLSASIEDFRISTSQGSLGEGHTANATLFASTETPTGDNAQTPVAEQMVDPFDSPLLFAVQSSNAASSPGSGSEPDDLMTRSTTYTAGVANSMLESVTSSSMFQSATEHYTSSPDLAQSVYLSSSPDYKRLPGYFPEEPHDELSKSTATVRSLSGEAFNGPEDRASTPTASYLPGFEQSQETSGFDNPLLTEHVRANPSQPVLDENILDQVKKRLISLDNVSVWLPNAGPSNDASVRPSDPRYSLQSSVSASAIGKNMPGTFSAYADMSASRRLQTSYLVDHSTMSESVRKPSPSSGSLDIDLGVLDCHVDSSSISLLHQATSLVKPDTIRAHCSAQKFDEQATSPPPSVSLRLRSLKMAFHGRLKELPLHASDASFSTELEQSQALIRLHGRDITFGLSAHSTTPDITFAVRRLTAGIDNKDLLLFPKFASSQHDKVEAPDVLIKIQRSKITSQGRPITDVRAWLRPIRIDLDLPAIDDALLSFGGLSGIMELSASVLSSGSDQTNMPPSPPRRGVRFQEDVKLPANSIKTSEIKLNVHLQGALIALSSHTSSLELDCSTVKFNSRTDYVLATIGSAKLYEKPTASQKRFSTSASMNASRFVVDMKDLKLEYVPCPDDVDLERFLSLITPSKDKYENDDDILLDTLLRQRRKGAVMRMKLNSVTVNIRRWTFVDDLQSLSNDLSKFAAVTKYLPEDDRPGPLIFPRIVEFNAFLPVNDDFGILEVNCKEVLLAQIGLPALVALSVGSVRAGPLSGGDIVHELLRSAEQLPVIMMRMIGDEVEPTVKVKLFNLCGEYSVPIIAALLGTDTSSKTKDIVDDLAASILSLAVVETGEISPSPTNHSAATVRPAKKIDVNVLLHDCAIGLKPCGQDGKGVLVLSDTKFSTVVPPEDTLSAKLELRKASLHITDYEVNTTQATEAFSRSVYPPDQVSLFLATQGFVSISSIMSAQARVNIRENKTDLTRSIEVEVRDELFLLETCADSTQTLVSILNGLAPPTPPSTKPKFRTEVATVEDMMASFTGDAVERPSGSSGSGFGPHTLFDVDETSPPLEVDALLEDSIVSNSLFGPVGGEFDIEQGQNLYDDDDDINNKNIESFLEDEDYLEISESSVMRPLPDDDLWDHVQRQCSRGLGGQKACLKPEYLDVKQFDKSHSSYAGQFSKVLGGPTRFATPAAIFPSHKPMQQNQSCPFQLHVRDVHIIWNLYDGYDWEKTRTTISEAVEEIEQKLEAKKQKRRRSAEPQEEEESVIGDFLFNSIYIGVAANRDSGDLSREVSRQISRGVNDLASESESYATSGTSRPSHCSTTRRQQPPRKKKLRLSRSKTHKIAFELRGVSLDFFLHPPESGEIQSSIDIRLRNFEIFDNVPTSTWRKFLTYHYNEGKMREMGKPMVHIELLNVQPVPDLATTEILLKVAVLPLRLHVDQDALDFITRFFEFKPDSEVAAPPADPPFIQRIEVNTVKMCLDYKPKRVDYAGIRSGHTGEFKNFVSLDRASIKLKHVIVYGLKGFDALHPTLSDIWTPDVIRNQLPGVLAGLGPLRPLVNLGAGVRNIVAIPIREYKKDGRLYRSIQKGASQFARTTTAELARLGAKLAVGTHTALSSVEEALGQVGDQVDEDVEHEERRRVSNYADQPLGVLQGLQTARLLLERDLLTAKDAFIAVQGEVIDAGSASGAAQAVLRRAPTIVLRPFIGTSKFMGQALMGVGNQIDRSNVQRNEDKYKPR